MKNRKTNEKETIKAVAYTRYSSHNQHETSVEVQRTRINLYCADHGIELIDRDICLKACEAKAENPEDTAEDPACGL